MDCVIHCSALYCQHINGGSKALVVTAWKKSRAKARKPGLVRALVALWPQWSHWTHWTPQWQSWKRAPEINRVDNRLGGGNQIWETHARAVKTRSGGQDARAVAGTGFAWLFIANRHLWILRRWQQDMMSEIMTLKISYCIIFSSMLVGQNPGEIFSRVEISKWQHFLKSISSSIWWLHHIIFHHDYFIIVNHFLE